MSFTECVDCQLFILSGVISKLICDILQSVAVIWACQGMRYQKNVLQWEHTS